MTTETQLIGKMYYKNFIINSESHQPVQILGELYLSEKDKETFNLSEIRFAQGEVYFHNKDFEAAIFKWEKVNHDLEPWAKKNIADAYFELGQYSKAENIYNTTKTENITLNTEVALQLFSLYIEQGKLSDAFKIIKKGVSLNPDYPNITKIARTFYEEQQDWSSALELVIQEATRKESKSWFDILKMYVDNGYTKGIAPNYFVSALETLYQVDQVRFEQTAISLWNSYRNQECYLEWLQTFNNLFIHVEITRPDVWQELSNQYHEAYLEIINGKYFMNELSKVIPNLLTIWFKISSSTQKLFTSAAVLAWNEVFPQSISANVVIEAEEEICHVKNHQNGLDDSFRLLEQILNWAQEKDLRLGNRSKWWMHELLDLDVHHLLIAGVSGSGKSDVLNSILGEELLGPINTSVVMFKNDENLEIHEISETKIRPIETISDFDQLTSTKQQQDQEESWIEFRLFSQFLYENKLAIIDTPDLKGSNDKNEVFRHLNLADGLLFILDANCPFTEKEADILQQIQDHNPNLPIHFLINKMDSIYSEHEAAKIVAEAQARINDNFSNACVFPYSASYQNRGQFKKLAEFIHSNIIIHNHEENRNAKLLIFIRKTIMNLLDKRVEAENELLSTIEWKESIVTKLNGAINQLKDNEKEKAETIVKNYHDAKTEIKKDIITMIPTIIKNCADIISEESDFRQIHVELNEEMNSRVHNYLEETILPKFYLSIQDWITHSTEQLQQSSIFLMEMNESFHALLGDERLNLECDFHVLNDWQRDAERLTSRIQIAKENILLRLTPAQLLLKGAGKLFGAISQNKSLLSMRYKKYIENEDFYDVAVSITNQFLLQFDLFENALERDIEIFFRKPFHILDELIAKMRIEIIENEDLLNKMKEQPEVYLDPLAIFEVRLRQFELIMNVKQKKSPYPYLEYAKKMVQK